MKTIRVPEIVSPGEGRTSCAYCVHIDERGEFCNGRPHDNNNYNDACSDGHTITIEDTQEGHDKYVADKARYRMGIPIEEDEDEG